MSNIADIALAPSTRARLTNYLARPSHGVLLEGKPGVGLFTIAQWLATQLNARPDDVLVVAPDEKGTITIERVRSLYVSTRAQHETARVVIIDDADAMSLPAQNALLKVLEEPTAHTHFILTSHQPQSLLSTITSRAQRLPVTPLAAADSAQLIRSSDKAVTSQLLFMAAGLPAELARLQDDPAYFETQVGYMKDARAFIEGDSYTRLVFARTYSTNRLIAEQYLSAISHVLEFTLFRQKNPELARVLVLIETIRERLAANAHIKTQLAYLVTQFN